MSAADPLTTNNVAIGVFIRSHGGLIQRQDRNLDEKTGRHLTRVTIIDCPLADLDRLAWTSIGLAITRETP